MKGLLVAIGIVLFLSVPACDFLGLDLRDGGGSNQDVYRVAVVVTYPAGIVRIALGDVRDRASFRIVSNQYKRVFYPAFSPSGRYLIFVDGSSSELGRGALLKLDLNSGAIVNLASNQDDIGYASADVSPIVWLSADTLTYSWPLGISAGGRIVRYSISAAKEDPLLVGLRPWFAMGARSILVRQYRGTSMPRFLRYDFDTSDTTFVANPWIQPALSDLGPAPWDWNRFEGRFLYSRFSETTGPNSLIGLTDSTGTVDEALTDGTFRDHEAVFGPGQLILFIREEEPDAGSLLSLNRVSGEITTLLEPGDLGGALDFSTPVSSRCK